MQGRPEPYCVPTSPAAYARWRAGSPRPVGAEVGSAGRDLNGRESIATSSCAGSSGDFKAISCRRTIRAATEEYVSADALARLLGVALRQVRPPRLRVMLMQWGLNAHDVSRASMDRYVHPECTTPAHVARTIKALRNTAKR
jgi:hypothetical protein